MATARPIIGLNMALQEDLMSDPLKARALCHLKYIDAVTLGGGIPLLIPPYTDRSMIAPVLAKCDGFCLIGGRDYLPSHYGGHDQPENDLMHKRRHDFDLWLAEELIERTRKPVLGVCGGHQLINIACGGALVQDLSSEWKPDEKHASTLEHSDSERKGSPQEGNVYRHVVRLAPGSRLEKIIGAPKVLTNSYHHQAVQPDRIGRGLRATAWAPDGVIEAVELDGERLVLGVQWHPERQTDEPAHRAIFEALAKAAAQ